MSHTRSYLNISSNRALISLAQISLNGVSNLLLSVFLRSPLFILSIRSSVLRSSSSFCIRAFTSLFRPSSVLSSSCSFCIRTSMRSSSSLLLSFFSLSAFMSLFLRASISMSSSTLMFLFWSAISLLNTSMRDCERRSTSPRKWARSLSGIFPRSRSSSSLLSWSSFSRVSICSPKKRARSLCGIFSRSSFMAASSFFMRSSSSSLFMSSSSSSLSFVITFNESVSSCIDFLVSISVFSLLIISLIAFLCSSSVLSTPSALNSASLRFSMHSSVSASANFSLCSFDSMRNSSILRASFSLAAALCLSFSMSRFFVLHIACFVRSFMRSSSALRSRVRIFSK